MTRLRSAGLFVSAAAATALLSAPIAFADDGHADRNRGRDVDGHVLVTVMMPASALVDEDRDDHEVNEDRDEVQVAPAQPQPVVEVEQELKADND